MANSWIEFVKSYASEKGMSYKDALKTKGLNEEYKKGKEPKEIEKPMEESMPKIKKQRKSKKLMDEE